MANYGRDPEMEMYRPREIRYREVADERNDRKRQIMLKIGKEVWKQIANEDDRSLSIAKTQEMILELCDETFGTLTYINAIRTRNLLQETKELDLGTYIHLCSNILTMKVINNQNVESFETIRIENSIFKMSNYKQFGFDMSLQTPLLTVLKKMMERHPDWIERQMKKE